MLKVSYIGFNEYLARIKAAPANLQKLVDDEMETAAQDFEMGAKNLIRSHKGGGSGALLKSIHYEKKEVMKYNVSANLFYAPYYEFGTKRKVSITPGFEDVAASARGLPKRGNYKDMVKSLMIYLQRNGRPSKESDAKSMAYFIFKYGIMARPFFFPNYAPVRNKLKTRIENLLKSGI